MNDEHNEIKTSLDDAFSICNRVLENYKPAFKGEEIGIVKFIGHGIARAEGLAKVEVDELVQFPGGLYGFVFNLDPEEVGIILLGESDKIESGCEVRRTGRVLDVSVGNELLGRVVDPLGQPLDGSGPIPVMDRLPVERNAPPIMARDPVAVPLQTGIKVVDALIPIGRGQRELILGDRQSCKTAIALDTIINQRDSDVICVYCSIGQRSSATAQFISDLKKNGAMEHSIVVVARGEDPPGLKFITPYAATSMAEYFMEQGRDVLIVYDDLTRHAWAYRELSLLLRRPPGREAFPGDIFYIHSRLLERSTHLRQELGGGSLSALPIIETEGQNISAYIPTNLISITDGQIYVFPSLFQKGILPAVDIGKSVSRIGGKAQLAAYRSVSGNLRLTYSQFEEMETLSRFDTRLDEQTRKTLERGRRIREVLKQSQHRPQPVPEQIAVLLAVTRGLYDPLPLNRIEEANRLVSQATSTRLSDVCTRILQNHPLTEDDEKALLGEAKKIVDGLLQKNHAKH